MKTIVFREFKHFQHLHNSLVIQYPGMIIPYLPPSSSTSPSSPTSPHTLEPTSPAADLQLKLQCFLDNLTAHPLLQSSPSLRIFLQDSLEQFLRSYQELKEKDRRRRSSLYQPTLRERVENKLHSFLNGNEVSPPPHASPPSCVCRGISE